MRRTIAPLALACGLCLLLAGCGTGKLRTQGKLLKSGQPLIPQEGESVRVTFVPILPDGKPPMDHYFAEFDPKDATFRAAGKDREGMPPGKYRVAVEFKRNRQDIFQGRYDENRSPFVFEVGSSTSDLVIDVDAPPKN